MAEPTALTLQTWGLVLIPISCELRGGCWIWRFCVGHGRVGKSRCRSISKVRLESFRGGFLETKLPWRQDDNRTRQ